MKQFISWCAAVLGLALFLTACAPKQDPTPDAPVQSLPAESTRFALPFAVGRLYDLAWADVSFGVNDGKAFYKLERIPDTENAADSQQESYNYLITRIDYETLVQAPLCSLPDCMHQTPDCPAFVGGTYWESFSLAVIEGQLYVLHNFDEGVAGEYGNPAIMDQMTVWLDRAATDGSGRRRVAALSAGWVLDPNGFPVTDGDALYGQYADLSNYFVRGVRVALETGETTTFSFGLDDSEQLLGAWNGQFILLRSDDTLLQTAYPGVMTPERNDVFRSAFGAYYARSLLLYDPATGTRTDLSDALMQAGLFTIPYYTFIQQGKFYYINSYADAPQTVWQIGLTDGTVRVLTEFPPPATAWYSLHALRLFPAGSDHMEPYVQGSYWLYRDERFLLDIRDGSVLEIGLRYTPYYNADDTIPSNPIAQTDSGLWLVPVDYRLDPWGNDRIAYALAAPETVITGAGDVYPIQMWSYPDEALG